MRETTLQRSRRQAFERKLFVEVLRRAGNVVYEEVKFDPKRRWRFDVTVASPRVDGVYAIEIEGLNGRHQSMKGFLGDMEKYNAATMLGYRLLRFTTRQIGDGTALEMLSRCGVSVQPPTATAE